MRKLFVVLAVTFLVAVLFPGSGSLVGAQSNDCQMLGWTGLEFLPPDGLGWRGDVENADGTLVRELADHETFGWSPDGTRFASVVTLEAASTLHLGTEPSGSADVEIPGVGGSSVVWSPTGDRVLVSSGNDVAVSVVDTAGSVVTLDMAGRNASWSFDGAWVAWSSADGIEIARPDGSGAALLAPAPANGSLWRPGSHQLLVLAPSFLIADADTLALTPFTVDPVDFARDFAWSPDGSRLAWSASVDGTAPPRIWVNSFDGTGAHAVSPLFPSANDPSVPEPFTGPFWSPDGSQLAVGESDGPWSTGFTGGSMRVRLIPADGSGPGVPMGDFPDVGNVFSLGELVTVVWSPDRQWIAIGIRRSALAGGSSVTGVSYSITRVNGSSARDLGGSFRVEGHIEWWPVVGVIGEGGACVLASDDETIPASPPPATRPQFTG